jgi:F-type H+-transporting ATPase subunit alpha
MSKLPSSPIPLFKMKVQEKGRIRDIKEIIVRVEGLPSCLNGQIVDLGEGVKGIIMGFDEHDVLVLVLGEPGRLRMGNDVFGISEPFKIPVGEKFIGRAISALGSPCDQRGDAEPDDYYPVFKDSPPITHRGPMDQFLPTGCKMVDIFVPLSKGQRELILGDRMTGKTAIAIDAILNQKGRDVICIYCAVGKSMSAIEKATSALHDAGALDYSIVIVATDAAPAGEQYLVPFAAASMGDYFATRGRDVLVVFDDLTKHAWAYRQLSLLLDRPPGREAYPGDIFYVQTQLMERAAKFNTEHGGGSMTFLGIAETQQGDLTGYIPSNLASMCDGQICMSGAMFAEGFRPAIDISLSLSIVGGRAQPPIVKSLNKSLRADYARYSEVVKLSKLQSGLSGEAEKTVRKGESILSVLRQGQFSPVGMVEQTLLLYALDKGLLMKKSEEQRNQFRKEIFAFAREHNQAFLDEVEKDMRMTLAIEKGLADLMEAYFKQAGGSAG